MAAHNAILTALLLASIHAAAVAADPIVLEREQQRVEVVQKVAPTVVAIFARGGQGGGSGVLITPDGYALTNYHVTSGAGDFMKCGLNDGVLYDAVIVGIDPTGDVALIKLLGRDDFPHATLGDSDALKVGDYSYAMGNPFLLATDFQPTVTYGIISGVHRYQYPAGTFLEYTDCIQTDTSINPGNSGGPLFNSAGELVGINGRGSFEKRGRVNSGAGYAISINQIKHFMDHLKSGRIVDHATLGATVATRDDGAVVITNILEESDAYRRGVRQDDELVSFAGRTIRSVNQYKNILGIYPKGWKLPLVYRHENEKKEIWVRMRGLHAASELTGEPKSPRPTPRPRTPPKPGEPPQPGDPPMPQIPMQEEEKPPEKYAHMFIKRTGYANAYFNQLERDRLLKAIVELGDFSQAKGAWKLSATMAQQPDVSQPVQLTLADGGVGLVTANEKAEPFYQDLRDDAKFLDEPPGSGGFLLALHHLRMMLTKKADGFSEFYYLGSEPFDGRGETVDVLVAGLTGVESWWYFSRKSGQLLGFDLYLSEDADPCEIRIAAFADFGGRKLPSQFVARHTEQEFARFTLNNCEFQTKPEPKPAAPEKKPEADPKPAAEKSPEKNKP